MNRLNYKTLDDMGFNEYLLKDGKEKVLQFGEGNFLRAFVDYFIDLMNEKASFDGKIVVVQPIDQGLADMINEQDGLFTLFLRGRENGKKVNNKRVISSIKRCINPYKDYDEYMKNAENADLRFIVSNTTEAGITYDSSCKFDDKPASSFPAKVCQFLYKRYELGLKGFIILNCELIDHNGDELKRIVNLHIDDWGLGKDFKDWVNNENYFCSTLVDRIVTGYPRNEAEDICKELGYEDKLLDTAETFGFWVIEGPQKIYDEFPVKEAGLDSNIIIVDDHMPYKQRKVRILNGAHTSMVLGAYLAGQNIVRDCMNDEVIKGFMNKVIYDEVIPTLDLPKEDLLDFAEKVTDRFNNPYVDHLLLSISLNSTSKWAARVMPTLLEYVKRFNKLPKAVTMSFAFYIKFYHNAAKVLNENSLTGKRGNDTYEVKDDKWVLEFYNNLKDVDNTKLAQEVISNEKMWGDKLKNLDGFYDEVVKDLDTIDKIGTYEAMKGIL